MESSPLFSSQLEHLQVLFTLFWKLAKIKFIGDHPDSKERTGGLRYIKNLEFTTNIDLIDLMLSSHDAETSQSEVFATLLGWLEGQEPNTELSKKLKKFLTILSEDTWFKHNDTTFLQEGIYSSLQRQGQPVGFEGETKGPLRILNSAISNDLHHALKKSNAGILYKEDTDIEYLSRVSNFLDIQEVNSDSILDEGQSNQENEISEFPRNLILYGAPGTGKSYKLKGRIAALNPAKYERVTFYSDYSYSQFIGGYRPVPVYISKEGENLEVKDGSDVSLDRPGHPAIEYSFVAGPMLRLYVESKLNPENIYLIGIEELNRADAAAVFGDFFQLLDRKSDGTSEYDTQLSKEARQYLESEFKGHENLINQPVSLPSNLYIWATLNSADQGVFPIDTAFKRRWEFEYLPLNENETVVSSQSLTLAIIDNDTGEKISILWNDLRNKINQKLSEIGIQEDLMIGPFFLSPQEMKNDAAFKHKLLAYLRDDILRHQYHEFFKISGTLDHIIKAYEDGDNIFNFDLN